MKEHDIKERILDRLWTVVDGEPEILSASLVGSFAQNGGLEGISDIDLVVILEKLNGERFRRMLSSFDGALRPALAEAGYDLMINPTLGPLKFNDPGCAVLHLMLYSRSGHIDHAIRSPFTCFDWQRTSIFRKQSMTAVYPVYGLQPHHFFGARRSASEYLRDLRASVVSYREITPADDGVHELPCTQAMSERGRHEYSYHIMKFLMQNFLKLVLRTPVAPDGAALVETFFNTIGISSNGHADLFLTLRERKRAFDFSCPIPSLGEQLESFVTKFEQQFRKIFYEDASHHVFFRHAATSANQVGAFLGRANLPIDGASPAEVEALLAVAAALQPARAYSSPMERCKQSISLLDGQASDPITDDRLVEIDCGECEGLTPTQAQEGYPDLFEAWGRGEDPRFPGGESTADVRERLGAFLAETITAASGNSIICSHNVVLRCLVGELLGIPQELWWKLDIPHLAPIHVIHTRRFGLFVDIDEQVERKIMWRFAS